MLGRNL